MNTKHGELNKLNKITARDLYLLRWVLEECDDERRGLTNPSTLDDEDLQALLQSAISAWNGGARLEDNKFFTTPLVSVDAAVRWIYDLIERGLDWHFDDNPLDITTWNLERHERESLRDRQQELFKLLVDPHEIAYDALVSREWREQ